MSGWKRFASGVLLTILTLSFSTVFSLPAAAASQDQTDHCTGTAQLGVNLCHGYFYSRSYYRNLPYGIQGTNILKSYNNDPANWSIPNSVVPTNNSPATAKDFEKLIGGYLGCTLGPPISCGTNSYDYNKAGAAFLVDSMLGIKGPIGNAAAAIRTAQSNFPTWVATVDYYEQGTNGVSVNWSVHKANSVNTGTINSMHVCSTNFPSGGCPATAAGGIPAQYDSKDFVYYKIGPYDNVHNGCNKDCPEDSHEIVFTNADGSLLRIRRECANIVGNVHQLSPPPSLGVTCVDALVEPDSMSPKEPFSITAKVRYSPQGSAGVPFGLGDDMYIHVTDPSGNPVWNSNGIPQTIDTVSGVDEYKASNAAGLSQTGVYTVTYGVEGPYAPGDKVCDDSASVTFTVEDQPYFSAVGGDVSAGASMGAGGTECATKPDDSGGVVSWNRENSTYDGAGTQYAAFAMNYLQDFASAQGTPTQAPDGLSFSNTINVAASGGGADTYGGAIDSEPCVPDYFSGHPANATYNTDHTFMLSVDMANPGTYKNEYIKGNLSIKSDIPVQDGSHTNIYVQGNVYIDGNITYSNSYSDILNVPSFSIIAQGNIYVDSADVTELDGWYIAQPDDANATDGIFYSCATGMGAPAPWPSKTLNGLCQTPLKVYGSVVARQVWLERAFGSLYSTGGAEQFYFTPETWLANPLGDNGGGTTYDAITTLPPSL